VQVVANEVDSGAWGDGSGDLGALGSSGRSEHRVRPSERTMIAAVVCSRCLTLGVKVAVFMGGLHWRSCVGPFFGRRTVSEPETHDFANRPRGRGAFLGKDLRSRREMHG
jgi:hypothetical protein